MLILLAGSLMVGCQRDTPDDTLRKARLSKLGMTYHAFNMIERRTPRDADDLTRYLKAQNKEPDAIAFLIDPLRSGEIVLIWNVTLSEDGEANDRFVLGYEKAVPQAGGYNLTGGAFVEKSRWSNSPT